MTEDRGPTLASLAGQVDFSGPGIVGLGKRNGTSSIFLYCFSLALRLSLIYWRLKERFDDAMHWTS